MKPDQGDTDHQRRGRGRRALRVAHGVLPGQRARHAPQAGQRRTEHPADRPGEDRTEDGDAEEHQRRTEADHGRRRRRRTARRPWPRHPSPVTAERRSTTRRRLLPERSTATSRMAAIGRHLRRPAGGEHRRGDAHAEAGDQRDDDRAAGEHDAAGGEVDAHAAEQRLAARRRRRCRRRGRRPRRSGRRRRPRAGPSRAPGGGWRRWPAAAPSPCVRWATRIEKEL